MHPQKLTHVLWSSQFHCCTGKTSRGGKSRDEGMTGNMEAGRVGTPGETQLHEGHAEKCGRLLLRTGKENPLLGKAFLTSVKMCLCLG